MTTNSIGKFHAYVQDMMGTLDPNCGNYGTYFADFPRMATLSWDTDVMPLHYCEGDSLILAHKEQWVTDVTITGPDFQEIVTDTLLSVSVEQSGPYAITGYADQDCPPGLLSDTVWIQVHKDTFREIEDFVCQGREYHKNGFHYMANEGKSLAFKGSITVL